MALPLACLRRITTSRVEEIDTADHLRTVLVSCCSPCTGSHESLMVPSALAAGIVPTGEDVAMEFSGGETGYVLSLTCRYVEPHTAVRHCRRYNLLFGKKLRLESV